jgi:hypothetical protein
VTAAPSDADRQRLHDVLVDMLKSQAQHQITGTIGSGDWLLADTIQLARIKEESYDPPSGKPGTLLKLTLGADFSARYIKADDMQQLIDATLDASKPPVPAEEVAKRLDCSKATVRSHIANARTKFRRYMENRKR